ncbi:unnamed protein product [Ceutorhynchus assimilis]|uniref:Uncharacterized protein n=1 Tax=Ceutorhynchus assimilis TaxID=467358 RepID=A0A9P0DBG4_9CUCU|nr:unnamed protein product [Ceutorhynchus assimilis]
MDQISMELDTMERKFTKCFCIIQVSKGHILLLKKFKLFKQLLRKTKLQLCYILQEFICEIAYLFVLYGNDMLTVTLKLSTLYNKLLQMDVEFNLLKNSSSVCNNTCPYLLFPLKKISVTRLLQILSYHRAEYCCHKLIDCLLETYKMHENSEDDNSSDNSSLEIYMALTKHLSPPVEVNNTKKGKDYIANVDDSIGTFINLEELISYEETNVINLINATQQVAPAMLGKDGIKKIGTGIH